MAAAQTHRVMWGQSTMTALFRLNALMSFFTCQSLLFFLKFLLFLVSSIFARFLLFFYLTVGEMYTFGTADLK